MARFALSPMARLHVGTVIAGGLAAGGWLIAASDPRRWDLTALLVLGLGALASAGLALSYQGTHSSRVHHHFGTAYVYALVILIDPGIGCLGLWLYAAVGWASRRSHPVMGLFNLGQLGLALLAADAVHRWLAPAGHGLRLDDPRTLAAGAASLAALEAVNVGLTTVAMNLTSRRRPWDPTPLTAGGLLNEILCLVSGLGMAVLWAVHPVASLLGMAPLWVLAYGLRRLHGREQELELYRRELDSLHELGLEIGSELAPERLHPAIVRIAAEGLQASGALLATLEPGGTRLRIHASRGIRPAPPSTLDAVRLLDGFFEGSAIRRIGSSGDPRSHYPELGFLDAEGLLCAPVSVGTGRRGVLVVFHDRRRRPFDEQDVDRLETLVRFVEVALSNAELFSERGLDEKPWETTGTVNVSGLLDVALARFVDDWSRQRIDLVRRVSGDLPAISGDRRPLRQLLTELLRHAGAATMGRAGQRRLTVEAEGRGDWIRLRIVSNGPPPEDVNALVLARRIAELHGGRLQFADDGGLSISLDLPAEIVH